MAAPATKNVTGYVLSLAGAEIDGAVIRFDLSPAFIADGDAIIVGVKSGQTLGEVVTPLAEDGSFTAAIVAVDNPTWTIHVVVDGPNVETPVEFDIIPPPATGSGDVGIGDLITASSAGTDPVIVNTIRGAQDYDDSVAPALDQVIKWNGTDYAPADESGGGGSGLPAGGAPGQILTKISGTDGDADWETLPSSLTQGTADLRYAQLSSTPGFVIESGGAYPARPSADVARPHFWLGVDSPPTTGSNHFVDGVDVWVKFPS